MAHTCAGVPASAGDQHALGWHGNVFTEDPQYGNFEAPAADIADVPANTGVYLAALGDAAEECRLPSRFRAAAGRLDGCFCSEAELLGHGPEVLSQNLQEDSADYNHKVIVVAPTGRTFLRSVRRGRADVVTRGFDQNVETRIAEVLARLPDWKVIAVRPASSALFEGMLGQQPWPQPPHRLGPLRLVRWVPLGVLPRTATSSRREASPPPGF